MKYEQNFIGDVKNKPAIGFMQLELMKGWTLDSTLLIIDESQDLPYSELRNILSRIAKDSKVILLGSFEQIDVSMRDSAIYVLEKAKEELPKGVVWNTLTINNRNEKMFNLIKKLDKYGL